MNKNIIFYKATKRIAKIEVSLLQNFINKNATKLLKFTTVITYGDTPIKCR